MRGCLWMVTDSSNEEMQSAIRSGSAAGCCCEAFGQVKGLIMFLSIFTQEYTIVL